MTGARANDDAHQGKVALITGGGRGFGQAFGTALAARGAHVVLADIDGDAAAKAAAEITANGGRASAAACDVADEDGVAAMIDEVTAEHGVIDILVNNAGLHSAAYNKPSAEIGVAVMGQQILDRAGEERDIVEALLFLVSPAASFVTGETLRVTGGFALSV